MRQEDGEVKEDNIKHLFGDDRVIFEECDLLDREGFTNNRYVLTRCGLSFCGSKFS